MYELIDRWLVELLGDGLLSDFLSILIKVLYAALIAAILYVILKIINSFSLSNSKISAIKVSSAFVKRKKIIFKTAVFVFFVLTYPAFSKFSSIGSTIMLMILSCDLLDMINAVYVTKEISRKRPIKGILSVIKIAVCILFAVILISILLNQNPVVLVSGVGAFTAIISLIFQDIIKGFVAGLQITSENLFEIGDWISIPSLGVEGEVKDIALVTVKVQGFDNIMYTLPASTFQSTSFKNWHNTIKDSMRQVNFKLAIDPDSIDKDGNETNLTKWRHFVLESIRKDPHYKEGFALQCKTSGASSGFGIPVDIFFTTDITDYDAYCEYVSEFGSNMTAALKDYGLKCFKASSAAVN